MIEENEKMGIPALGNGMSQTKVMGLCLGWNRETVIWVKYKKTSVEGKTRRELSMNLWLLGSWMISAEGLCPDLAWGRSFWHQGEDCVTKVRG